MAAPEKRATTAHSFIVPALVGPYRSQDVPFDDGSQIEEFLEWLASAIAGLGFLVPIAFILLFNLFGKKDKDKQREQPSSPPQRQRPAPAPSQPTGPPMPQPTPAFPFGPSSWMEAPPETERPPRRQAP